ncbi:hypothetical protein D910_10264, partial [Dendroctonus ponderosae]
LSEAEIACNHFEGKRKGVVCNAGELTRNEILGFREMVYANDAKKIDQDKILLKFMQVDVPKRKTTDETVLRQNRKLSVKYSIRTSGDNIPVCAATFQKITGARKDRLSGISKKFIAGELLVEKRGGRVLSQIDKEAQKLLTVNHVSDLKKSYVKKLLRGMGLTDEVTTFYDEVMKEPALTVDNNADEIGQDDDSEVDV